MRLWTIQSAAAWQALQQHGILRCDPAYSDPDWAEAYAWLVAQVRQRIGQPAICQALLWAWYQWNTVHTPRPDLRTTSLLPRGMKGVRLEVEIDESQVVLSDFELWHYVLNGSYLAESEADDEAFYAELHAQGYAPATPLPLLNPALATKIRTSWLHIFDLDWAPPDIADPRSAKSIQAVVWEVTLQQVRRVKEFTAR